jgi:SAM-dependent methyltransferase
MTTSTTGYDSGVRRLRQASERPAPTAAEPPISPAFPAPASITHLHLLAVINTELARFAPDRRLRILDAGCGDGKLISFLTRALPLLHPERQFEVYGYDVYDHGVQAEKFMSRTVEMLSLEHPQIAWEERTRAIAIDEPWPYAGEFFDVIVSNQVLEHVGDLDGFFVQLSRALRWGGFSAHLFPLKSCVWEGHLNLPLAHRIQNHDFLRRYIRLLSSLGLGKYREQRNANGITLEEYAERHADYIQHLTSYVGYAEVCRLAKRSGLRVSFRYTQEFYFQKLRQLLRLQSRYQYRQRRSAVRDWLAVTFLQFLSCTTVLLEKQNTYVKRDAGDGRRIDAPHRGGPSA